MLVFTLGLVLILLKVRKNLKNIFEITALNSLEIRRDFIIWQMAASAETANVHQSATE